MADPAAFLELLARAELRSASTSAAADAGRPGPGGDQGAATTF